MSSPGLTSYLPAKGTETEDTMLHVDARRLEAELARRRLATLALAAHLEAVGIELNRLDDEDDEGNIGEWDLRGFDDEDEVQELHGAISPATRS